MQGSAFFIYIKLRKRQLITLLPIMLNNKQGLREFDFAGLVFGPLISFVDIILYNAQRSPLEREGKVGQFQWIAFSGPCLSGFFVIKRAL
jgi:hypothetical protein